MSKMNNPAEQEPEVGSDEWWNRPTYASTPPRRAKNDYVSDLWSAHGWGNDTALWGDDDDGPTIGVRDYRYGRRTSSKGVAHVISNSTAQRAVVAHGMVQTFVDSFSSADYGYRVTFDPDITTAATDFRSKRVVISPAPVFDKALSAAEAGLILTGMAVHEVAHVRYHQNVTAGVTRTFKGSADEPTARRLSNILGDVHDEAAFSRDYPGYSEVFDPTLDYVAKEYAGKAVGMDDPLNFACGAIRYSKHLSFPSAKAQAERDWWQDWAQRGASQDGWKWHVEALKEAIAHIGSLPPITPPIGQGAPTNDGDSEHSNGQQQPQSDGQPSGPTDKPSDQQGGSSEGTDKPEGNPDGGSDGKGDSTDGEAKGNSSPKTVTDQLPTCSTEGVGKAASAGGVTITDDDKKAIQKAVEEAATLEGDPDHGMGEVLQSPHGINVNTAHSRWGYGSGGVRGSATAAIRAAFMRSRTGTTTYQNGQKHGHLSGRDLQRIAFNDTRLFEKRIAPGPGKYLIWVMVDCSSSMGGTPIHDAADVAQAFVEATHSMGNVRAAVWGWTSPFKAQQQGLARWGAVKVWDDSRPTSAVQRLTTLPMGGTPDAAVLAWAVKAIAKNAVGGEQPIICMVSDGQGFPLTSITTDAMRRGVRVVGVNIDRNAPEYRLRESYGPGNYTTWPGSIEKVARPLGNLIAKAITPKSAR